MNRAFDFQHFDVEQWFVKRLAEHGRQIFLGSTTPDERRERIRAAILERGVDVAIIGKLANGRPESYAQAFERFYGASLYKTVVRA